MVRLGSCKSCLDRHMHMEHVMTETEALEAVVRAAEDVTTVHADAIGTDGDSNMGPGSITRLHYALRRLASIRSVIPEED